MSEHLHKSVVPIEGTIADAMHSLEGSSTKIVLIVDEAYRLEGTLTDGDIRRALLAGKSIEAPLAPHINRDCFTVDENAGRSDVLELMQARSISQVPVVAPDSRVVGLHLLHEMITAIERSNWAVVMAGGMGTRLGQLTREVPKPMLPVAGRPILERIVLHLVGSGIRRVYLSVNYLGEVIERHFQDGHRFGCTIEYLREKQPLGTAGSLALLPEGDERPEDPILVMNGDLVTQANMGRIIDYHEAGDQAVTLVVRKYFEQIPYGCVEVDGDELLGFVEKPTTTRLINAGIYVVDPDCLNLLERGRPMSMPDLIGSVRATGQTTRVLEIDDDWIDVGRHDQLEHARTGA